MAAGRNDPTSAAVASPSETAAEVLNLPVDHEWLARNEPEEVLEPALPIVDAHHHLWDRPGSRYMPPDLLADVADGHHVVATIYVENYACYRSHGPEEFQPVGETEVMARIAEGWTEPAGPRLVAAIVGYADLFAGARVRDVLEAHVAVALGRFRGIRQVTAWDDARSLQPLQHGPRRALSPGMLGDPAFREGFAQLAPMGLVFDVWQYHPQIDELTSLARAFPETSMVLNHVGGPVHVGPYTGDRKAVFSAWADSVTRLAACPNVSVKIGGLGMRLLGFGFRNRTRPPGSAELADLWRPYVEHCIDRFGVERCMFESNFPVDKAYFGSRVLWNAFKRLTSGASSNERQDLFAGTANRVYRLDL
jgi:predicted TIM-barrel fold metal-dependent hydrolase